MPRPFNEGAAVVVHYLATTEAGTVERIEDDGRTLVVVTEHDDVLHFHLMASTYFITADHSARLTHAMT